MLMRWFIEPEPDEFFDHVRYVQGIVDRLFSFGDTALEAMFPSLKELALALLEDREFEEAQRVVEEAIVRFENMTYGPWGWIDDWAFHDFFEGVDVWDEDEWADHSLRPRKHVGTRGFLRSHRETRRRSLSDSPGVRR